MKFLSFAADGKGHFGAVSGDGVVTLNDKVSQPTLLAAGALEDMRRAAKDAKASVVYSIIANSTAADVMRGVARHERHRASGRDVVRGPLCRSHHGIHFRQR